jgi:predicted aldo/keto reductase-like oxidoreductase
MQYRPFGKIDWDVSVLGFGAMRLPVINENPSEIDEPEAIQMIRLALDSGVNYVDTAYPYHGGKSEVLVGKALQDGYREKARIATKLPSWLIKTPDDFDRYLDEQFERLQVRYVDFYLLHALKREWWDTLRKLGVFDWAERALADGRIGHLGFSFHDEYPVFEEIIRAYDGWTLCQIMYNYMDVDYQAGTRGLHLAADKGVAVVVMEPLRGGLLTGSPPESVADLYAGAPSKRSPADWALQWVWSQPEVSVVLSGMSSLGHVEENLRSADGSRHGLLNAEELEFVDVLRAAYRSVAPVPCTNCKYCLPCPEGVDIPRIFETFNMAKMYNDLRAARQFYTWLEKENRGDKCTACGTCEEQCPQGIAIAEWIEKAHALLG